MAENHGRGRILRTWKDVAAYLQCSVRTCRRWEKAHGLPTHRVGTTLKSGIFAYEHELDDWLRARSEAKIEEDKPKSARLKSRGVLPVVALALIGLAVLSGIFLLTFRHDEQPADFRFDEGKLIIIDRHGTELWPHDTHLDNLSSDEYREHFQTKRPGIQGPALPYLIIKDINRDGRKEVLFSTQTKLEIGEGELFCFDHAGRQMWHYKSGREMTFGHKVFSGDYRIKGIDCADLNGDGKLEVLVIAAQRPEWPCQFTILDCEGTVIGEYWNGGHIADYAFADLNGDNRTELVLSGCYNEKKTGFLAVFDSADIRGGSPQEVEEFISLDIQPGSEIFYVLIPRTDVDLAKSPVEALEAVSILKNRRIQGSTSCTGLYYEFGSDLRLLDIKDSHKMQQLHQELLLQGKISSEYGQPYLDDLKKKVIYWTGNRWTNQPTAHNPWGARTAGR